MSSPTDAPPDPSTAYTTLLELLLTHLPTAQLDISILPSSFPDIILTSPHLGIPKPHLLAAFSHARDAFASSLDASLVLLLVSPEHITALNARKRHLLAHATAQSLAFELRLTASLLSSRTPRANKSPTMWEHRRWLLTAFALPSCWETEMALVYASAEVHSGNYYAWNHARWALARFAKGGDARALREVLDWAQRHVSDCGPWSLLAHMCEAARDGDEVVRVLEETMTYGREVARGHEALWGFVRTVLGRAGAVTEAERVRLVHMLEQWTAAPEETEAGEEARREVRLERTALGWVRRFGNGAKS